MKRTTSTAQVFLEPFLDGKQILELQEVVRQVVVADHVFSYACDLVRTTRPREKNAPKFVKELLAWGAGPRASQFLILGGKARAILHGRLHVTTDDIRAVAHPVLRHRIVTTFNADAEGITPDQIVDRVLEAVPLPQKEAAASARRA
jgi:MoxR-like ATPase